MALAVLPSMVLCAGASATITVTNLTDTGTGTLREAIATAKSGETIVVPAGTIPLSKELKISKSLTIEGSGSETTTISGGGKDRVFEVSGEGSVVLLTGLGIREGLVKQPGGTEVRGGGVLDEGASLTLLGVVVAENHADTDGGPKEESAVAEGGGIYASGPLALSNVTVRRNEASAVGGTGERGGQAVGGGIYAGGVSLEHVVLAGNTANAEGGSGGEGGSAAAGAMNAVPTGVAPLSIAGVELLGNTAEAFAGAGAGGGGALAGAMHVFSKGPSVAISNLTASENTAIAGGAGAGTAVVEAGALEVKARELPITLTNLTIAGNTARALGAGGQAEGGGLKASANKGPLTIASSTIDANTAEGAGKAAGGDLAAGGGVQVRETIVSAGIGKATQENCFATEPLVSLGDNLDSRDECAFHAAGDKVNADPQLSPLRSNGGPLQTQAIGEASPARDGGAAAGCPGSDERGVQRPQGAACDIGAFEFAPPAAVTAAASGLGATSATLNGVASNPGVIGGTVFFEYGTSIAYGSHAEAGPLGAGASGAAVSTALSGLTTGAVYHFRVVARTPEGTAFGADRTFVPIVLVSPAPVLSGMKLTPSRLKADRGRGATLSARRGATLSYRDSQAALATFTIQVPKRGFVSGRRCLAAAPRGHHGSLKRCTRYVSLGTFTHSDPGGPVRLHFTGRVRRKPLAPGAYRLQAVARSTAGVTGTSVFTPFRIVR